jgi:ATP-binding protein involved in chromosome partitioning
MSDNANPILPSQIASRVLALSVPDTGATLAELGRVERVSIAQGKVELLLELAIPAQRLEQALSEAIWDAIKDLPGVEQVAVEIGWAIEAGPVIDASAAIPNVKNIVAVASGKGGVGKSTTAINLALALKAEGAVVGVLDADIYGPSIPALLGVGGQRPAVDGQKMVPIEAHGLYSISMGYLVTEQTPMVWRGPMASGALQQLLQQTAWPELDYLIIDMPPGTGDIQLTLSQKVPVTGSVVVTTPQDIALLDAKKGIEMFRKVHVPVLGVIENMATHICTNCGHEEHIFGEGGGERIARDYQTQLLGALPLDLSIRQQADAGCPTVAADPDSDLAMLYRVIAIKVAAELAKLAQQTSAPLIQTTDD